MYNTCAYEWYALSCKTWTASNTRPHHDIVLDWPDRKARFSQTVRDAEAMQPMEYGHLCYSPQGANSCPVLRPWIRQYQNFLMLDQEYNTINNCLMYTHWFTRKYDWFAHRILVCLLPNNLSLCIQQQQQQHSSTPFALVGVHQTQSQSIPNNNTVQSTCLQNRLYFNGRRRRSGRFQVQRLVAGYLPGSSIICQLLQHLYTC